MIPQPTRAPPSDPLYQLSSPSLLRTSAFVNGKWTEASDGKKFEVTNPANGKLLAECSDLTRDDIKQAIAASAEAFPAWAKLTAYQRQGYILALLAELKANVDDLAIILAAENGKPLAEAKGEVAYGNGFLEWFAGEAVRTYGHSVPAAMPNIRNNIIKQPVGPCALITPWNFPNAMISRKLAPALAAGCTMVIKAPAETPLSALAICSLAEKVGIPAGVLNVVTVSKGEREAACGAELCENPAIRKLSFTGSTPVGQLLMKQCAGSLKKMSMELGGNAAFIVFDDANLEQAVTGVMASKYRAAGQTCVCANRIFVQSGIYDKFAEAMVAKVSALKMGDPLEEGVTIGPLVNDRGVEKAIRHIDDAVAKGAKVALGGKRGEGLFVQPTVLLDVPKDCAIASEETFGPVAALFKFESESEVIQRANSVDVGLAAYFFTRDASRITRVSEALEVGMIGCNTGMISQPCIPFGGVKHSGFGREGGRSGIDEYMIEKLVSQGIEL